MTAVRKVIVEHPAHRNLVQAAKELGKAKDVEGVPDAAIYLIDNASSLVRGSIDVLLERDPLKHELGLIIVMLTESTERKMEKVRGEMRETYTITDEYLFSWALQKAYALPRLFNRGT
jgi:hypothetical protein